MTNLAALPADLDDMPAHDAFALLDWWREQPPTSEVLAAVYRVQMNPPIDPNDPSGIGPLILGGAGRERQ